MNSIALMSGIPSVVRDAEAQALRDLYEKQAAPPAHGAFGKANSIGTAGMVWQYLNGHRPLNMDVAVKFAMALGTTLDAFSPRLATAAMLAHRVARNHMAPGAPPAPALVARELPVWRPFERIDEFKLRAVAPADLLRLEGALLGAAALLGIDLAAPPRGKRRSNER
jgi:hypothetical protein